MSEVEIKRRNVVLASMTHRISFKTLNGVKTSAQKQQNKVVLSFLFRTNFSHESLPFLSFLMFEMSDLWYLYPFVSLSPALIPSPPFPHPYILQPSFLSSL